MPGSYIHTLRYFSGFWARRATPDRVLKILAGGYFDIKRGHSALQVSLFRLPAALDIWAMWEYRRVRLCGNRYNGFIPAGEGLPDGVVRQPVAHELCTGPPLQAVGTGQVRLFRSTSVGNKITEGRYKRTAQRRLYVDVGWLCYRVWEILEVFSIVAHEAYLDAVPLTRCGWAIGNPFPDASAEYRVLNTDFSLTGTAMDDGVTQFQILLIP